MNVETKKKRINKGHIDCKILPTCLVYILNTLRLQFADSIQLVDLKRGK